MNRIDVLYFAWVRERIGLPKESRSTEAATVNELVDELRGQGPEYVLAFSDLSSIRVSIDQELVNLESEISNGNEVAFFPLMTGG